MGKVKSGPRLRRGSCICIKRERAIDIAISIKRERAIEIAISKKRERAIEIALASRLCDHSKLKI
jgi:hypothetical protein